MMIWSDLLVALAGLTIVSFSELAGFFRGGENTSLETLCGLLLATLFLGQSRRPTSRTGEARPSLLALLPLSLLTALALIPAIPDTSPLFSWTAAALLTSALGFFLPLPSHRSRLLPLASIGLTLLLTGTLLLGVLETFLCMASALALALLLTPLVARRTHGAVPLSSPRVRSSFAPSGTHFMVGLLGGVLLLPLWRLFQLGLWEPARSPAAPLLALSLAALSAHLVEQALVRLLQRLSRAERLLTALALPAVWMVFLALPPLTSPLLEAHLLLTSLLKQIPFLEAGARWLSEPLLLGLLLALPVGAFTRLATHPTPPPTWSPSFGVGLGAGLAMGSSLLLNLIPAERIPGVLLVGLLLPAAVRQARALSQPRSQTPEQWVALLGLVVLGAGFLIIPFPTAIHTAQAALDATQEDKQERILAVGLEGAGPLTVEGPARAPTVRLGGALLVSEDTRNQERLAALLPLLLRSAHRALDFQPPPSATVYGPGSGQSVEMLLEQGVAQVSLASPTLVRAQAVMASKADLPLLRKRLDEGATVLLPPGTPWALARVGHQTPLLVVLPPPLLERRMLYTQEGFAVLRQLLAPDGQVCVVVPLDKGLPILGVLSAFYHAFPSGLAWLDQGSSSSLLLTGWQQPAEASQKPSYQALVARVARKQLAERLRNLGLTEPADVLELLLLPTEGLAKVEAPALTQRGPLLYQPDPSLPSDAGPALLPYLTPIASAFTDLPEGDARLLLDARLEQARLRHASWLELVGHLEKGTLLQAMQSVEALRPNGTPADPRLDTLVAPYLARVDVLNAQTRPEKALEQLAVARLLHPGSPKVWLKLGETFRLKGETQRAKDAFARGLELAPTHLELALALADLLRERKAYAEAATVLQGLVGKIPPSAVLYHNLGTLALTTGDPGRAQEALLKATQLDPLLGEAHSALATLYLAQGRLDAALQEAEAGARLKSTADTLAVLGQARMRRGDTAGARTAFVQALSQNPDQLEARGSLGILFAEAGQIEEARSAWEAVLAIAPDNRAAQKNLEQLNRDFPPQSRTARPPLPAP